MILIFFPGLRTSLNNAVNEWLEKKEYECADPQLTVCTLKYGTSYCRFKSSLHLFVVDTRIRGLPKSQLYQNLNCKERQPVKFALL